MNFDYFRQSSGCITRNGIEMEMEMESSRVDSNRVELVCNQSAQVEKAEWIWVYMGSGLVFDHFDLHAINLNHRI